MNSEEPVLKITKYVGILPHDCPGGISCAFPDLEHLPAKPAGTQKGGQE